MTAIELSVPEEIKEIVETAKFKTKESKELFDTLVRGLEDIRHGRVKDWEEVKKSIHK